MKFSDSFCFIMSGDIALIQAVNRTLIPIMYHQYRPPQIDKKEWMIVEIWVTAMTGISPEIWKKYPASYLPVILEQAEKIGKLKYGGVHLK